MHKHEFTDKNTQHGKNSENFVGKLVLLFWIIFLKKLPWASSYVGEQIIELGKIKEV